MKKIFIYLIAILAYSCSVPEDNVIRSTLETTPIETASVPQFFEFGQTYQIDIGYILPSDCHTFNDIFYQREGDEHTFAIVASVFPGTNCLTSFDENNTSFDFTVGDTNTHIFKFWQGKDIDGNDLYMTMEIPVQN